MSDELRNMMFVPGKILRRSGARSLGMKDEEGLPDIKSKKRLV